MKKEFLTGLTAMVLAIGLVLAGCEGPTGADGAGGGTAPAVLVPSATATTAAGAEKYWAEGEPIVYFLGDLVLGSGAGQEAGLTIPSGKTLILADLADLRGRAVSASGKGKITVKAGGALKADSARLVVPNGTSVTVQDGNVALTGTTSVIVGKSVGTPVAGEAPARFDIQGGTVTATGTATLAFATGAKLEKSGGTLTAAAGTVFAFEDATDLNDAIVQEIAGSGAGSESLDVGGTIDAETGKVAGGTVVDPSKGVSSETSASEFITALGGAAEVVTYTGADPVSISTGITGAANKAITMTDPAASLTIAASSGSLTLGKTGFLKVAGPVNVNGTIDVSARTTGSFWAAFTGAGTVTVSNTGVINQGGTYGIGSSREFSIASSATITYVPATGLVTITGGTVSLGQVLELTKPLTVATGATLDLSTNSVVFRGAVPLTVNGTLKTSRTTSMWSAFDLTAAAGSVVINGSYLQGDATWGIGADREFVLTPPAAITYDGTNVTINGAVTAYAKGTGGVFEWTKPHIVNGTLTLAGEGASVTGTVQGTGASLASAGKTLTLSSGTLTVAADKTLTVAAAGILTVNGTLAVNGTATVDGTAVFADTATITGTGAINVSTTGIVWNKNEGSAGTSLYGAGFTGKIVLVDGSQLYIGTGGSFTVEGKVSFAKHYWIGTATNTPDSSVGTGALVDLESGASVEISRGSLTFKGAITARDLVISPQETLFVEGALTVYKSIRVGANATLTVRSEGTVKGVTTGNSYIRGDAEWFAALPEGTINNLAPSGAYVNGSSFQEITGTGNAYKWDASNNVWIKKNDWS
jgi:hypothetical protein